jgi:hypothetical protein
MGKEGVAGSSPAPGLVDWRGSGELATHAGSLMQQEAERVAINSIFELEADEQPWTGAQSGHLGE